MSIVIDEKIMAIWYVKLSDDLDLMIALQRDGEGGYRVNGRTRIYASKDDPWDEQDVKRWFEGGVEAKDDEDAVNKARSHMVSMTASYASVFLPPEPPQLYELVRGTTSVEKFAEVLQSMPWAHSMEATRH